jgi:hypothetical protein
MVSSCLCFLRHCPVILTFLTTFPPYLNHQVLGESNWVRLKGRIPLTHTLIKIGASLECECCLWIVGVRVSQYTMWVWVDTYWVVSCTHSEWASVHSLSVSVSELFEYRRKNWLCYVFWHVLSIFAYNYCNIINKPSFMSFGVNFWGVLDCSGFLTT